MPRLAPCLLVAAAGLLMPLTLPATAVGEPPLEEVLRLLAPRLPLDTQRIERAALEGALRAIDPGATLVTDAALSASGFEGSNMVARLERWEDDLLCIRLHGLYADQDGAALNAARQALLPPPSGLILDLRAAGGDDLDTLDTLAGLFFDAGTPLYDLRDGFANVVTTRCARATESPTNLPPVMLLTDGETRGASAALAAILRGRKGVMLIGSRTDGDTAQRECLPLASNVCVRLSTRWLVPRNSPDYYPGGVEPHVTVAAAGTSPAPAPHPVIVQPAMVQPEHEPAPPGTEMDNATEIARALAARVGNDLPLRRAVDILLGLRALRHP